MICIYCLESYDKSTSDTYCLWRNGVKGEGPYNEYDAVKATCENLASCNMFYKGSNEVYYTCPPDSLINPFTGYTLFSLGKCYLL